MLRARPHKWWAILGDVNNDNQVDIADALLVLLYTLERFSFVAPNQGNIALGDVNEDGLINLADVLLIMTYIANPLDPTLPDGIGLATEQTAVAVAVEQDRAVLIALYEATGGDNWEDNTNWLISTSPLDQWYGVTTDDAGRVDSLELADNQLTGTIPETLGQLNNLRSLDLSGNDLTGEIPQALGQLNNLKYLNLIDNQLTGCIPSALLDVSVNDLNDPRPAFCLPGRADPISIFTVSFPSNDGVEVSAIFGTAQDGESLPVVILLHDLGGSKADWLNNTGTYVALLKLGYAVLAIDMRGHGETPLPDDRQVLELIDLELSYRDVQAALVWLPSQSEIDVSRIAVVGSGSGGNVAYVSSGLFPEQIKTSVSLSPGLWGSTSLEPLVIGAGLEPFDPRSILFMVGDQDQIPTEDVILSYADFARNLEAQTAEPKDLRIFPDSADHGFELLNNIAEAHDLFFLWLEEYL